MKRSLQFHLTFPMIIPAFTYQQFIVAGRSNRDWADSNPIGTPVSEFIAISMRSIECRNRWQRPPGEPTQNGLRIEFEDNQQKSRSSYDCVHVFVWLGARSTKRRIFHCICILHYYSTISASARECLSLVNGILSRESAPSGHCTLVVHFTQRVVPCSSAQVNWFQIDVENKWNDL